MNGSEPLNKQRYELFAQHIAKGELPEHAYVMAGGTGKHPRQRGAEWRTIPDINERITYLMQKGAEHVTDTEIPDILQGVTIEAKGLGPDTNSSARLKAWELLGKYRGMWSEKQEHTGEINIRIIRE
jgi:hypothetical protein